MTPEFNELVKDLLITIGEEPKDLNVEGVEEGLNKLEDALDAPTYDEKVLLAEIKAHLETNIDEDGFYKLRMWVNLLKK